MYQSTCTKCESKFEQPRDSSLWSAECSVCTPRHDPRDSGRPSYPRTCEICGVDYTAKSPLSRMCSSRCRSTKKMLKQAIPCSMCGEKMFVGATTKKVGAAHNHCRTENPDGSVRHGTSSAYKRGCRCAECREAKVQEMREYSAAYREKYGISPTGMRKRRKRGAPEKSQSCTICSEPMKISRFDDSVEPAHKRCKGMVYVPVAIRQAVFLRDNYECHLCGEPTEPDSEVRSPWFPSLDHVIPRSHGGSDDIDNLKTSHLWCNSARQNRSIEDFVSSISP